MIVIEAREVACKLPKAEDLPALASQKPHIWMEKSVVRLIPLPERITADKRFRDFSGGHDDNLFEKRHDTTADLGAGLNQKNKVTPKEV